MVAKPKGARAHPPQPALSNPRPPTKGRNRTQDLNNLNHPYHKRVEANTSLFFKNNTSNCYSTDFIQHKTLPFHFNNKMNLWPSTTNLQIFLVQSWNKKNEGIHNKYRLLRTSNINCTKKEEKIIEVEGHMTYFWRNMHLWLSSFTRMGCSVPGPGIGDSSLYMIIQCRATFQKQK